MKRNQVVITGTEDVAKLLNNIAPKHAKNLLRSTVHAVAARVGKQAKENAKKYKDTGTLQKSIKWRRKKSPPEKPVSIVYVKPEAFYWRFVEYGTKKGLPERPVFRLAEQQLKSDMPKILVEEFAKKLEAKIKREAKKAKK